MLREHGNALAAEEQYRQQAKMKENQQDRSPSHSRGLGGWWVIYLGKPNTEQGEKDLPG